MKFNRNRLVCLLAEAVTPVVQIGYTHEISIDSRSHDASASATAQAPAAAAETVP